MSVGGGEDSEAPNLLSVLIMCVSVCLSILGRFSDVVADCWAGEFGMPHVCI